METGNSLRKEAPWYSKYNTFVYNIESKKFLTSVIGGASRADEEMFNCDLKLVDS